MEFLCNAGTKIIYEGNSSAVCNGVRILERDITKVFTYPEREKNQMILRDAPELGTEEFVLDVGEQLIVSAADELGFVYGLLYISERFLGIKPFWFWMDQKIERKSGVSVPFGSYRAPRPTVKYRGWFVNDEVLIMKWNIDGDSVEPWRMVFEALLRCGGNMVIPGTDKNSKKYQNLASEMGLWLTHHHAEPLGAEMFVRAYPEKEPNYAQSPELFWKLWEDAVQEQKDYKVIWSLGFRGQGDCPFWSNDTSGQFDTAEKRGALISDIIERQRKLILQSVKNPVFCTNLYGEIMELYEEGHIHFADDIIKIYADNGFGKMVTRRRDNHTVRISSMPKQREEHGGIYYHVSFYDLQAANHITMLPNSVDFVDRELSAVLDKNASDYWVINCSNVRPHAYYLDAVRKKWYGGSVSDSAHSAEFARDYFHGNEAVAELYRDYPSAMLAYGAEEDEHAGEQFYTENVRLLIHTIFNHRTDGTPGLRWLTGLLPLDRQIDAFADFCRGNLDKIDAFYQRCLAVSDSLTEDTKQLFDATLLLHVQIHDFCTHGVVLFDDGYRAYAAGEYKRAFVLLGDSASWFDRANAHMRAAEYGVWNGFYENDCFADVKYTAYMVKKLMGLVREHGDNSRHDKWYRDTVYAPEDRKIMTLLVNDNHMTDWELYEAMKKSEECV